MSKVYQDTLRVSTPGRSLTAITGEVKARVQAAGVRAGLCNLFIRHTSASLILCENADPDVRVDLENFMQRLVADGDPRYRHALEGPDDMAAHIRTVLTASALTLPVAEGRLALGTWQGIYLWEHRTRPHQREVLVTVQGS
ncbi:MAG: YjbQ family protein [Gammaproteobacteria bacterium]|nr:MAG: YjbQ family protein [Gammaproteobacteria bacterium]